ncbi:MAG: right-handed parallel beta-helix repeat-containing protein [Ignavibacteriae bacterium]|nr:right-handed parallel beta-helix repeat-containing protein [Ignavibacteriota bacterium]
MKVIYYIIIAIGAIVATEAQTREVGIGRQYLRLQDAASVAQPGDTILIREGIYTGGDYVANLQGNATAWITIRAMDNESVIFRGGSQAFHLSDPAYLRIEGLVFEQQTGNGVNIDDAATIETPAHHIIIQKCEWRSMNATGNNDELKMSGVDEFTIRLCRFLNGSAGGSMVDMVGCHKGTFEQNLFENGGSNCIQAKGASKDIRIEQNRFIRGGQRAINIGGSTGLEFFRPPGANYEAANIYVYSNIFFGSMAPIAYVGAINCEVVNNTIIRPERWAIRILQETTASSFLLCGNNSFRNNIVVFNTTQPAINIGGNTAPETFTFSNNLWFNPDNSSWNGPNTPLAEPNRLLNTDPQFLDTLYRLQTSSPAIGKGYAATSPKNDFFGKPFAANRSIGAVEAENTSVIQEDSYPLNSVSISPNPAQSSLSVQYIGLMDYDNVIEIINVLGYVVKRVKSLQNETVIDIDDLPNGFYSVRIGEIVKQMVIVR